MSDLSSRLDGLSQKQRAALLELLRKKREGVAPVPVREEARAAPSAWEDGGTAPASFSQERLWLLDQLQPGTPAYNIPGAFRLTGDLDAAALVRAFREIERRHAALRTVFTSAAGRPVQRILPFRPREYPRIDLSALPEGAREAESRRLAAEESARPFDLETGPLFRAALVLLGPREHLALYTMHHVVSDGWSLGVFAGEVAALYEAFVLGHPSPLGELPLQVPDFALRQRVRLGEARLARELEWWTQRLAGLATLELPADRPCPPVRVGRGGSCSAFLAAGLGADLAAAARGGQATLYMALLAAFQALLHRLSHQDDVAVGSPVANRSDRDLEALIGFFVNTLVMRTDASGDPGFRELLARVRRTALDALLHQEAPFEKVVEAVQPERRLARSPLFQVMFSLQNLPHGRVDLPGLALERMELPTVTAKFDLSLIVSELPQGLGVRLDFDLDLYDPATAERWLRHLETLAAGAVAAPDARLSALPLLTPMEREQVVAGWNRTAVPIPRQLPLHRLVEEQVDRAPQAVAVAAAEGEEWTYAALDARANRLAHRLRRLGAGPEVPVLVLAGRSPELVAALLAVMKSGSFFVPLDPAHPRERLLPIVGWMDARLAVTEERFLDLLPEGTASVCLDRDRAALAAEPASRPEGGAAAGNLLYVLFTSGSTGEPKGVAVTHGNVVRLVRGTDFSAMGPGETFLMLAPVSFDASTLELWGPLANGGRLAVFPPHLPSLDELAAFLERQGVTQLWLTAGLFHQMVDQVIAPAAGGRPQAFAGLRRLLAGGDVLSPDHVRRALAACPGLVLVNGYGPTEGTTFSTCQELAAPDQVEAPVPIGRPIANTAVHVLEPGGEPAPPGVWGELWIGGEGLARGYFGRPDLTAERFVPDPFAPLLGSPGGRLYRTGDRVRRRPDGTLELLGRLDRQVKIRGFRIEPEEIEAVLRAHPAVAGAAVLVRGEGAEKGLVAYVAGAAAGLSGQKLRRWLAGRLPEAMVPEAVAVLESLPLTPNGKVDRRALSRIAPERSAADGGRFEAPRTPAEEVLAGLFAEVLGAERTGGRVGARDNFFELGGHSLLAAQVASRVRGVFAVDLPVRAVFEAPVLAELAERIDRLRGGAPAAEIPLVPVPRDPAGLLPLSFAQQRLWFLDRLQPGTPAYNIPSFFRLEGGLDAGLLERVLSEMVRRHESLRTTFEERHGEALQRIHPPAPLPLPLVDLGGLPEAVGAGAARRLAREEAGRGFDLERGPLVRTALLRLGVEEHVLLATVHHVVSDGWSTGVMAREISALYGAFRRGLPSPLPELPVQYADFAAWQRRRLAGEALESELSFWRRRLADLPAVLDLPTDRPRPGVQGFRGALAPLHLEPALSAALAALGRRERTTPFMTLLAAFQVLLARSTGQERFGVGTPVAGRNRLEIEPLIGFFVNTLVLRADLPAGPGFLEVLRQVREEALEAQVHQELPFEKLVEGLEIERSLSHAPLFQAMFAFQNATDAQLDLSGLALRPYETGSQVAKFDLGLTLGEDGGSLGGAFDYSTDLFDGTTIQRLARQFQLLLEALAADPTRGVWDVPLLAAAESHQLLVEWNDTRAPRDREPLLHRLVEEQAARTPEAVALEAGGLRLTYAELVDRARSLAAHLRGQGIGPGAVAALSAERTPDLIVSMLAVLQAGAAYLPIDPGYPRERREFMLEDSKAVLLGGGSSPLGGGGSEQGGGQEGGGPSHPRALVVGEAAPLLTSPLSQPPPPRGEGPAHPEAAAYVLYTSGSTGRPKGVVVPHRAISAFAQTAVETYALTPADRVLQFASISFDTSAEEIWTALAAGAALVLRTEEMISSIPHFLRELERLGITVLDLPTAFWHEMVAGMEAAGLELPRGVRLVILGGEEAQADRLALWQKRTGPAVRLVNTYGPTEATIVATRRELSGPLGTIPIGRPISGARAYVLDPLGAPVPPGVRGELWIGGSGVAQGYLGRPDLTAERFRPDPFAGEPGARLYRTGDLAFRKPDGDLVFAGRADRQVKLRGYRVEPGEIEAVLRGHPAVREAVVLVREEARGDRRLVAYLVAAGGEGWREWASGRLPGFMVPDAFVCLEDLPLTPGGKVDRRRLSQMGIPGRVPGDGFVAPRTPVEETLAGLFVEVLGTERTGGRAGVHDSFFALGGHSLLATRLIAAIREAFRVDLPLRVLFERPTLEGLAQAISEGSEALGEPVAALPRAPGINRFPVSFPQLREWILDRLEPGNPAYNIPNPLRIEGPLSIPVLKGALDALVRRHEVFRTQFEVGLGDQEPEPLRPCSRRSGSPCR